MRSLLLLLLSLAGVGLSGCGDSCGAVGSLLDSRCERLCCEVAERLEACIAGDGLTWSDVGAADRGDFARQCSDDWDRATVDLTAYELQEATGVCRDTRRGLDDLDCETLIGLYAPGAQP